MTNFSNDAEALNFVQSQIKIVTSDDDLPPCGENVVFLIPVRTANFGTFTESLETHVGYLSDEEYRVGGPIYVSVPYEDNAGVEHVSQDDIGWTVDIGTLWLPITNID